MCKVFSRSIGFELVFASSQAIAMPALLSKADLGIGADVVFVFATPL
jgi:hypothetical protein